MNAIPESQTAAGFKGEPSPPHEPAEFLRAEGRRPVEDIDLLVLGKPDRDTSTTRSRRSNLASVDRCRS
jgi:hypothetical protein